MNIITVTPRLETGRMETAAPDWWLEIYVLSGYNNQ